MAHFNTFHVSRALGGRRRQASRDHAKSALFGALRGGLSVSATACGISLCGVSYWYSCSMVELSDDEARDLVKTILEAIEAADEGTQVRAS